jgi:hydrogenase maturation protein HypF
VIDDVRNKKSTGFIGARFHQTLSAIALEVSQQMHAQYGVNEVALSGGVWQNQVLLDLARAALTQNRFIVYTHQQTPANDGGLALGQAVVAGFRIQNGDNNVS